MRENIIGFIVILGFYLIWAAYFIMFGGGR